MPNFHSDWYTPDGVPKGHPPALCDTWGTFQLRRWSWNVPRVSQSGCCIYAQHMSWVLSRSNTYDDWILITNSIAHGSHLVRITPTSTYM
jgi:hypothetical protein